MVHFHTPVLLKEVIEGLQVKEQFWYIDATAGGGGHTKEIIRLGGNVLALDQDEVAIAHLKELFKEEIKKNKLILVQDNFSNLVEITNKVQLKSIAGILFDLGMSTYQIKNSGRGFSFMKDEPLDMRMSQSTSVTAVDVINKYSESELSYVFTKFGEDVLGAQIAQAVVESRKEKKITTTGQLGTLISEVYKVAHKQERIHPATRAFQALRIEVNDELKVLKLVLPQAVDVLSTQGRLAVISFHSLEDRIVKNFLKEEEQKGKIAIVTKKPTTAADAEKYINPAARSAKLRLAEKL